MMLPAPRLAISAPRIWLARKTPVTLTSSERRKRSSAYTSKRDCAAAWPSSNLSLMAALLTSTSTAPPRASTRSRRDSTDSGTVRSAATACAGTSVSARRSATTRSHPATSTSVATTVAPADASARQCSRPRSPAAPVTTATCPRSENPSSTSATRGLLFNLRGRPGGLGLDVEARRAAEHRLDGLAAQRLGEPSLGQRARELRQDRPVGAQQVGHVGDVVGGAQVVEARPQHAVAHELLLHERLHDERVGAPGDARRRERHERAAPESDALRSRG